MPFLTFVNLGIAAFRRNRFRVLKQGISVAYRTFFNNRHAEF
jgi:hypothetical protein